MKETILPSGIKISKNQEFLIKDIHSHLKHINELIEFNKFNNILNIDLITSAFDFTYEKKSFFERDFNLLDEFNRELFLYENIKCLPFETRLNFVSLDEQDVLKQVKQNEIKIQNYKDLYIKSPIETFYILLNKNLSEKKLMEQIKVLSDLDETTEFSKSKISVELNKYFSLKEENEKSIRVGNFYRYLILITPLILIASVVSFFIIYFL